MWHKFLASLKLAKFIAWSECPFTQSLLKWVASGEKGDEHFVITYQVDQQQKRLSHNSERPLFYAHNFLISTAATSTGKSIFTNALEVTTMSAGLKFIGFSLI